MPASIRALKNVNVFSLNWDEIRRFMWNYVGMSRTAEGLERAVDAIDDLRAEYWRNLRVPGRKDTLNKNLEFAGRVADFMELGELMAGHGMEAG